MKIYFLGLTQTLIYIQDLLVFNFPSLGKIKTKIKVSNSLKVWGHKIYLLKVPIKDNPNKICFLTLAALQKITKNSSNSNRNNRPLKVNLPLTYLQKITV